MIRKLSFILAIAAVLPFAAHATSPKRAVATLMVPIYIEKADGKIVPVAELNKALKTAGVAEIPLFMEISSDEKDAYNKVEIADKIIENAISKAGTEWADASRNNPLFPTEGETSAFATCYVGDAVAVSDAASAIAGVIYTEQMNLIGMKYKSYRRYFNSQDDAEVEAAVSAESPLWKNWKGNDESVLLLSSVGDGGDDVQESLIPLCK